MLQELGGGGRVAGCGGDGLLIETGDDEGAACCEGLSVGSGGGEGESAAERGQEVRDN